MIKRVHELLFKKDFEYLEIFSGLALVGWSVALLLDQELFNKYPIYTAWAQLFDYEYIVGLLTMLLGIGQLFLVYHNTAGRLALRRYWTLTTAVVWMFISISFFVAGLYDEGLKGLNTGTIIYGIICLATSWAYIRLSIRYRRLFK